LGFQFLGQLRDRFAAGIFSRLDLVFRERAFGSHLAISLLTHRNHALGVGVGALVVLVQIKMHPRNGVLVHRIMVGFGSQFLEGDGSQAFRQTNLTKDLDPLRVDRQLLLRGIANELGDLVCGPVADDLAYQCLLCFAGDSFENGLSLIVPGILGRVGATSQSERRN
jgi:hypothetical protein